MGIILEYFKLEHDEEIFIIQIWMGGNDIMIYLFLIKGIYFLF